MDIRELSWSEISEVIDDLDLIDNEPDMFGNDSDKLLFIQALQEEIEFRREFKDARRQMARLENAGGKGQ